MKQILLLSLSSLVLIFLSCSRPYENHKKQGNNISGHLCISNSKQSFGLIKQSDKQWPCCEYELKNTGEGDIKIKEINTSCGCISTEIASMHISPGKCTVLKVMVNPLKQVGHFNKSIFINSDADNPLEIIRIKGNIIP